MSVNHCSTVPVLHAWTCLRSCECEVWAAAGLVHDTKIRLTPLVDMYFMSLAGTVCVWVCVCMPACVYAWWQHPLDTAPAMEICMESLLKCHPRAGAGGVMGNTLKQYRYLCYQTNRLFCSVPWLRGILTHLHKMSGHRLYHEKNEVISINVC